MAKEGSTVSGLMDSFALAVSIALQHGVPLKLLCEKFAHTRFEPSGWTGNPDIGFAKSIMDYIFRWLQLRFLTGQQQMLFDNLQAEARRRQSQLEESVASNAEASTLQLRTENRDLRTGSVHAADALVEHRRPGRRAHLQLLRQHHDQKRQLLQMHELRQHQRLQLDLAADGTLRLCANRPASDSTPEPPWKSGPFRAA